MVSSLQRFVRQEMRVLTMLMRRVAEVQEEFLLGQVLLLDDKTPDAGLKWCQDW